MRVDTLHRRLVNDVKVLHDAVDAVLPVQMPVVYESRAMNLTSFVNRLNTVTEPLGVFNEIKIDHEVDQGGVCTSALWIPKKDLPENDSYADIRVLWHPHPKTNRINMTPALWNRRRYFFWQNVMHEFIHRYQDAIRGGGKSKTFSPRTDNRDVRESQKYYGEYDEIETHSHAAAIEFLVWWPGLSFHDACHEARTYTGRMVTPTYMAVVQAFEEVPKHPALKHFKRKMKAWYDHCQKNWAIYELLALPKLT